MQYRTLPRSGLEISTLSFGTMRFTGPDNPAEIIDAGLPLGLNYIDAGAAYSYRDRDDNAESWVGRALVGKDRGQLVVSSKAQCNPVRPPDTDRAVHIVTRDQMWQCLENSLRRLRLEWLDFYQVWDMSTPEQFEVVTAPDGPLEAMREAKEQGLVKHLGFTTHDQPDNVIRYLEQLPDIEFITVYYNFSERYPEKAIEFARRQGVGVAIMGPLRGGLLIGESPVFKQALPELDAPVQELAFRFLLSTPGVTTCLSGMNEAAQVHENAAIAADPVPMTPEQRQRFIDAYQALTQGKPVCSGCRYCGGVCAEGLQIYALMQLHQMYFIFGIRDRALEPLRQDRQQDSLNADRCTACEVCLERCPSKVDIPGRMKELAELLG